MRRIVWVACIAAIGIAARADQISIPSMRDNTLFAEGALSNGAGEHMFAGKTSGDFERRALIRFDIAGSIPAGSVIQSVTLRLHMSRTRAGNTDVALHTVLEDWGEGTSDANGEEGSGALATPGDATWNYTFYNTDLWTTPGGHFLAQPSAVTTVGNAIGFYEWTDPTMVADVQLWLDDPSANFGWIMIGDESTSRTSKRFDTRENADPLLRPELIVTFTPPAGTGACCMPDGSCVTTDAGDCALMGGTYQGDGVPCDPNPCPGSGACCLDDGTCLQTSETDCLTMGGTYQGAGSDCAHTNCTLTLEPFVDPLPIPPIAQPVSGQVGGEATYEIAVRRVRQKLHRDLPDTIVYAYDGIFPGPTIEARRSQQVTVRWINDLRDDNGALLASHDLEVDTCLHGPDHTGDTPVVVTHLHGAHTFADSDGYPEDAYPPGQELTYIYPNHQLPATLWYHDHALGITRLNIYMGLAGFYLIRDDFEQSLDLPTGPYEIPMAIMDRSFNPDGSFKYPAAWQPVFYGDFPLVNGVVSPYLEVDQGRYRFRWLNASGSRTLTLRLSNDMPIHIIGSDGGLLPETVTVQEITLAPAERVDVILDFSGIPAGTRIVLENTATAPVPLPEIMEFRVRNQAGDQNPVPTQLRSLEVLDEARAIQSRDFILRRDMVNAPPCAEPWWLINGLTWDDITEFPRLGTIEVWNWINNSGMMHPMHMHLVMFQVLDRQPFTMGGGGEIIPIGDPVPPPPEEAGWKDTVQARPGEITRVIARFENYNGLFAYHCHIVEHEDHEMMRQFRAVCPGDLTGSSNPNDPSYGVPNDIVDADDFFFYLDLFVSGDPAADLTGSSNPQDPAYGIPNGVIDADDFFFYLDLFVQGCPLI